MISQKIIEYRYHKINNGSLSCKYSIRYLYFGTLILVLHSHCGDA